MRIMQKRDMQMSAEAAGASAGTNSRLMTVSGKIFLFCARRHPNVARQVER